MEVQLESNPTACHLWYYCSFDCNMDYDDLIGDPELQGPRLGCLGGLTEVGGGVYLGRMITVFLCC